MKMGSNQEQLLFCHALQCLHVIVCLLYLIHMAYILSVLYLIHMAICLVFCTWNTWQHFVL